jgi:hypothetical protein
MYKTEHGDFIGTTWEEFCQLCFKKKYETDGYQEMPAWQGDLGIEGFTRSGILFQCYCPDEEYSADILYEKQRDKITTDLKKIAENESELKAYLKDIKIKKWIFVTPGYKKKDIVRHCHDKAEEYRNSGLSILDPTFDVLIYDIGHFATEIPLVLDYKKQKIVINPLSQRTTTEIADWKTKEINLVDNAVRKHGQKLSESISNRDTKINKLTQLSIENFLNGNITVKIMQEKFPEDYEKFIRVVSLFERKVIEMCITNTGDNNDLYKKIENDLREKLKEAFSYIDANTIDQLTEQVLADWILRCPINFE